MINANISSAPPPPDSAATLRALMDALEPLTIAAIDEATRLHLAIQFENLDEDREFAMRMQADHWDAMAAAGTAALAKATGGDR